MRKPDTCTKKEKTKVFALSGNPNVGKSTVFNSLTGLRHHTGNWAGKTVDTLSGKGKKYGDYILCDLPGCYSLSSRSPEEELARDYICSGGSDAVIIIADATCLERNLYLVFMILEITSKVVLGVNMMDEAEKRHISLDLEALEKELGIPVVPIISKKGKGLAELIKAAFTVSERQNVPIPPLDADERSARAHETALKTVNVIGDVNEKEKKIDSVVTSRVFGFPIMVLLLSLLLYITVRLANYPSELLTKLFDRLGDLIDKALVYFGVGGFCRSLFVDGMYGSLSWVTAVMLPPMAIFFPLFTLLEDSGYLPRVAYNLDKPFRKCTSCGKQAITMCMGLGCSSVGVTGCRIIDSPRERLIAILTNCLVPCNGKFPTLLLLVTLFFPFAAGELASSLYLTAILTFCVLVTLASSKILSRTLLSGVPSSFVIELPPYRRPDVCKMLVRSLLDRTLFILARAASVAAPAGIVIWLCSNISVGGMSVLARFTGFLDPFAKLFGIDGVILAAFILGLPANEIVLPIMLMAYTASGGMSRIPPAAELKALLVNCGWTGITPLCVTIMMLFHWPCSTTLITVAKETKSVRWTLVSFILPTLVGAVMCLAINGIYTIFS